MFFLICVSIFSIIICFRFVVFFSRNFMGLRVNFFVIWFWLVFFIIGENNLCFMVCWWSILYFFWNIMDLVFGLCVWRELILLCGRNFFLLGLNENIGMLKVLMKVNVWLLLFLVVWLYFWMVCLIILWLISEVVSGCFWIFFIILFS